MNVISEDGMGLRLNISIRGLDPNRSRKVLVLEDGMPVSLNPYGSPELYYTPPIERMDRVEIVRGSGQILSGPQTIGGVINYITRDPPLRPTVFADLRYGSYGYLFAHAGAGATHGAVGWRLDVMHRGFDGPRRLDLALTDVTGRLRLRLGEHSVLRVKANFYDEASRATYAGLTTPQFERDPRFNGAVHDRFVVQRYAFAAALQHRFSRALALQTNFYAYETNRAWRRQEFERADSGADYERACDPLGNCGARGAAGVDAHERSRERLLSQPHGDPKPLLSRLGHRAAADLQLDRASPNVSGELTALARFHYERARRADLHLDADVSAEGGDPRDEEHRNGYALAAAVQHRFSFWNRCFVTPGVRVESFWSNRRVVRVPVEGADSELRGADVNVFGQSFTRARSSPASGSRSKPPRRSRSSRACTAGTRRRARGTPSPPRAPTSSSTPSCPGTSSSARGFASAAGFAPTSPGFTSSSRTRSSRRARRAGSSREARSTPGTAATRASKRA